MPLKPYFPVVVEWVELYALKESLKLASSMNISKAIFETDCASLANRVKKCDMDISIMGNRIKEIYKTKENFDSAIICWTNRKCNNVHGRLYF
ncbi:hypothetical protein CXB51_013952 [Gossypium anomalum]|uniref:RNase H type-1 domain-containing protein n=1 Tax=Gossypium anomalum TaxID=47600 RepID=A0A8J5YJV2_9ROSI|nr:hypothetical protein CXB51_013951 [Gossypium anomalum]KAG8490784.1 hypothetical protein CXB51_013952 [Gossypium anomalum]